MTAHVFIAQSLDGFIARSDGAIDWLMAQPTADEDHGYDAFIADMDGIMMGRRTYDSVRSFDHWPYSIPVVVVSQTLRPADIPEDLRDRVRIVSDIPVKLIETLTAEGWRRIYVDGGMLIQSCLAAGLIDTMTITTVPILLGSGRRLFGPLRQDVQLDHLATRSYPSGLVSSDYAIRKPATS